MLRIFVAATLAIALAIASSAEEPLFPSPSVTDLGGGDGWSVSVGVEAEYEAEYDGSDSYGTEVEPALIVHWRKGNQVWFLEGPELGWRSRVRDVWLVQAGLRLEGDREESEAPELAGLGDTDEELMAMIEVRRGLGSSWRNWLGARVMAGGSDIGTLGVLAAGHHFGEDDGQGIEVLGFTTFGSADFINRDFGVTPQQSVTSGLPATDIDGGYRSVGISAIGRWFWRERWQLRAEVGYEKYDGDIADSPIARDDYEAEVGLSALYRFR